MKKKIEADLKTAMLGGDKTTVELLRGLKSALNNEQISKRAELSEEESVVVLRREAKKRDEAAQLYKQGGANDKAEAELGEKALIERYLPARMDEAATAKLVDEAIEKLGKDPAKTGQIIGQVMASARGQADGATVARLVSERLQ